MLSGAANGTSFEKMSNDWTVSILDQVGKRQARELTAIECGAMEDH
jgi:hypothetical protein